MNVILRGTLPILCAGLAFASPARADDAKVLFDHGLYRRAAAEYEKRIAAVPKDVEAQAMLARVRAIQGDKASEMKLAQSAAEADPRNADAQYALAQAYGREAREASMLRQAGLAGKMKKAAEAALAIDPNHLDALEITSDFYRYAPGIMGGDKKKSVEYVDRMVRVDPAEGWIKRAEIAMDAKDSVRAAECYREAAAVQPPNAHAQMALASWLLQPWRDPAASEKLALAAVGAEPWRTGGWQVLAALYAYQGRWSDLDDVLKRSEAAEPTHLGPWYTAGRGILNAGKDPVRAESYLRHYLTREPEIGSRSWAVARWQLGLALERQGKKPEAVTELEAALKLDPKLDDAKKDLKRLRG